jgi:hypothetical protein
MQVAKHSREEEGVTFLQGIKTGYKLRSHQRNTGRQSLSIFCLSDKYKRTSPIHRKGNSSFETSMSLLSAWSSLWERSMLSVCPSILYNRTFCNRMYKNQPLVPVLGQMNPLHILRVHLFRTYLIVLLYGASNEKNRTDARNILSVNITKHETQNKAIRILVWINVTRVTVLAGAEYFFLYL